jgi:abortive infection bacteriophage resistance protein
VALVQYTKLPLTIPVQEDLLLQRGFTGNRDVIIASLRAVSYYRLSGYWYPSINPDSTIRSGTTIDKIWRRYVFDRRLRMLVMMVLNGLKRQCFLHIDQSKDGAEICRF